MIMSFIMRRKTRISAPGFRHLRGRRKIAMSTKASLKYERDEASGQQFHLYNEVFDDDHVYLELEGFPFEAASSIVLSGQGPGRVAVRLPNEWARKLGLLDAKA
jgi:hypothetical protein